MFGEWLTHLITPCPQPYRKMGYLKELIAIQHRHRRCQAAWAEHLTRCQNLIARGAENCPRKGLAVVLGSGLLLDIPLALLAKMFDHVILVDVCHLRSIRQTVQKYSNVQLHEADISGCVIPLMNWLSSNQKGQLPAPEINANLLTQADYVLSSNLLAQLPLTPLAYLEKHATGADINCLRSFGRSVIDHHLSMLQSLDCPVCLISETLQLITDGSQTLEKTDPLYGTPLNYKGEEWWWEVAPKPEISPAIAIRLRIRGIENLQGSEPARFCRNTTFAAP